MAKVILITRALAEQLHDQRLALVARHSFEGPAGSLIITGDVGQDAEGIVRQALDRFGRIDFLINNVSSLGATPMPELKARIGAMWLVASVQNRGDFVGTSILCPEAASSAAAQKITPCHSGRSARQWLSGQLYQAQVVLKPIGKGARLRFAGPDVQGMAFSRVQL